MGRKGHCIHGKNGDLATKLQKKRVKSFLSAKKSIPLHPNFWKLNWKGARVAEEARLESV